MLLLLTLMMSLLISGTGAAMGSLEEAVENTTTFFIDYDSFMTSIHNESNSENQLAHLTHDEEYFYNLLLNVKVSDSQRVGLAKLMFQRELESKILKATVTKADLVGTSSTRSTSYYGTDYNIAVDYAVNIGTAEQLYDDYLDILTDYVTYPDAVIRLAAAEGYIAAFFANKV